MKRIGYELRNNIISLIIKNLEQINIKNTSYDYKSRDKIRLNFEI